MKEHDTSIDLLKFLAVIMITNSHFGDLYKDFNVALATFGVHGNALFFFISGMTICMSGSIEKLNFVNWYKRRLERIWPTLIIWTILNNIIFGNEIRWNSMIYGHGYWFLQFILAAYIVMYFILKHLKKYLSVLLYLSIIGTVIGICFSPKTSQSIYHEFHWFCYSSCMLLGALCAKKNSLQKCKSGYLGGVFLSFVAYFIIMSFGKGKTGLIYYTQLLALLPLLSFLYTMYATGEIVMPYITRNRMFYSIVRFIGTLCLEIYVVQFFIITDEFNSLFPLNTIIVFGEIVMFAYLLHISTTFFTQTINKGSYDWKKILRVI